MKGYEIVSKLLLHSLYNKNTRQEVCNYYANRVCKEVHMEIGEPLKIKYETGSGFTHEKVFDIEENDYGFWVETTRKMWRFDKT